MIGEGRNDAPYGTKIPLKAESAGWNGTPAFKEAQMNNVLPVPRGAERLGLTARAAAAFSSSPKFKIDSLHIAIAVATTVEQAYSQGS